VKQPTLQRGFALRVQVIVQLIKTVSAAGVVVMQIARKFTPSPRLGRAKVLHAQQLLEM
jgi:hypothetical protein